MTWTPAELAALSGWYDASDAATVNETAGSVISLADKSGGGFDAVSDAGAEEPTLGSIGGLTALSFDGVDDNLQTSLFHDRVSDVAIFFIAAPNGAASETGAPVTGGGAKNLNIDVDGTGQVQVQNKNQFTTNSQRVGAALAPYVVGLTVDALGPTISLGVDGVYVSQVMDASSNTKAFELGSRFDGTELNYRGLLGEVVVVQARLSTEDRSKVEGYLAHKWGTASALPAGHSYKTAPPSLGPAPSAPFSGEVGGSALALAGGTPMLTVTTRIDQVLTAARCLAALTGSRPGVRVGASLSAGAGQGKVYAAGAPPTLSTAHHQTYTGCPSKAALFIAGALPSLTRSTRFGANPDRVIPVKAGFTTLTVEKETRQWP